LSIEYGRLNFFFRFLFYYSIAECNNALIYPGIGFGTIVSQSRSVTDTILIEGAKRLASLSPAIKFTEKSKNKPSEEYEYNGESLLPDFGIAPGVNFEIGIAVAEQAVREGSAGSSWLARGDDAVDEIRTKAKENVWVPVYADYIYDEQGFE
jgi:malate dehydrogenase (oxaloacetate-decarboxylating)